MTRLYVLVRGDLSPSQQAVQAGHAIAGWCSNESCRLDWDGREIETKPWRWRNHVLVYLEVKNERELLAWHEKLKGETNIFKITEGSVLWREPDWDDQATALAVVGEREQFEGLPLLR